MNDDPVTRAEQAYQSIQQAIVQNRLPRGEFLSQRKLAELTGTSVICVRESLHRLENEGLLELVPRWGVRIPVETRERLIDRYTVREALEVMAVYLVCRGIREDAAARLRRLARECDDMQRESEYVESFAECHRQFHVYLAECSGVPGLRRELERISMSWLIYQSARKTWVRRLASETQNWHSRLIDTVLAGDPLRAQEAMHRHIQHGLRNDLEVFGSGSGDTAVNIATGTP